MKQLLKIAEENDIPIVDMALSGNEEALSHKYGRYSIIAIDKKKSKSKADYKVKLSHELGHCMTGEFYNANCPVVPRGRVERRAKIWSYRIIASRRDIISALRSGETELWQLAERFGVTEHFMAEMLRFYGLYRG